MNLFRALTVGAFGITIFLAVLVEGVVVSRADVGYVFSKPGRLVRTILAMNVLIAALTREPLAPIGVLRDSFDPSSNDVCRLGWDTERGDGVNRRAAPTLRVDGKLPSHDLQPLLHAGQAEPAAPHRLMRVKAGA